MGDLGQIGTGTGTEEGTRASKVRKIEKEQDVRHDLLTFKKITCAYDMRTGLIILGCSKDDLVVAGLHKLESKLNDHYQRFLLMKEYYDDACIIEGDMKSQEAKGTFGRFGHAVLQGLQGNNQNVKKAIKKSGLRLFKVTIKSLAAACNSNDGLKRLATMETVDDILQRLQAFSEFFMLKNGTHVQSHLFNSIAGRVDSALQALSIFEFIKEQECQAIERGDPGEYAKVVGLMEASINPILSHIGAQKMEEDHYQTFERNNVLQEMAEADLVGLY